MKLKNIKCLLAVCLCASALLVGCGQKTADKSEISSESAQNQSDDIQEVSRDVFAMDTYMNVTAYGVGANEAVRRAEEEIERLDSLLSTGDQNSEIYQINQNGGGILSEDTAYLVERSLDLYKSTNGAFDIAIYPVMKAWGFTDDNFRVPEEEELQELLTLFKAKGAGKNIKVKKM